MQAVCPTFSTGTSDGHPAVMVSFTTVDGGVVRATKEYSLAYLPESGEWHGDVIAHGRWLDLSDEEVEQLRTRYGLDAFVEDYLAFLG